MTADLYVTDDARGEGWHLMLGDSCERMAEIADNTVDLSVCSPPFDSLYTYSPTARDIGNCSSRGQFLEHYGFVVREQLRVTRPGRMACVHVQQVATKKAVQGHVGLTDFRGDVIRVFQHSGWIFYGEVTIWKNPQAQATASKATSHTLSFASKNADSARIRPALADYLLLFKKPGENGVRISHEAALGEVTNDDWIEWASPIWFDRGTTEDDIGGGHLSPVWTGIRQTRTLNAAEGRESADERHIAPLQLDFIDRCVRLWSNPGELIFSPFAGIGSEGFMAVKLGRRFEGIELKPSYWRTAVGNLRRAEREYGTPVLFGGEATA